MIQKLSHNEKIMWYIRTCHWMRIDHKYEKVEFVPVKILKLYKEFDRDISYRLMENIIRFGLKDPIMIIYYQHYRIAYIGEGNHRLAIAEKLGLEVLPVRVIRSTSTYIPVKGIKVKGVKPDWSGYVKGSLYPSEIGLKSYSLEKLCE